MEHACGDAAEGDALQSILLCQVKTAAIASCQLLFLLLGGNTIGNNRANSMDHMLGRQVISFGDKCLARSQQLSLHNVGTLLAKLDASG